MATAALYAWGFDILPADFSQVPLNLEQDSSKLRADAWKYARQNSRVSLNPTMVGVQSERSVRYDILELVYEAKHGNVFSRENLLQIEKAEDELFNNNIYQRNLCQLTDGLGCRKPMSVIRFFDGTYRQLSPTFYDPNFENIAEVLHLASVLNYTKSVLNFHLGRQAVVDLSKRQVVSQYTRSLLFIGFPLAGYYNIEDRSDEQISKLDRYSEDAFAEILNGKYKNGVGTINVYYFLRALFFQAISEQVIYDLLLAGASFTFIFLFMLFQTQSLWITAWAVFSILTCFFGANLIYRLVLDCRYIGIFHVLSVFMILGIGADDVFVFVDTWRASEHKKFEDLAARLSFVYRRAARAMLTTSFTTIVAFVTSVASPLLGVSTFGIFSALLVFVNYCSVILFFPTVIITYELFWKDWQWPSCCGAPRSLGIERSRRHGDSVSSRTQETSMAASDRKAVQPSKIIISFFQTYFYDKVVNHRVTRWVIVAAFFVFLCASIGCATRLEPDQEAVSTLYIFYFIFILFLVSVILLPSTSTFLSFAYLATN